MIIVHPDHKRFLDLLDEWQFLDIESLHSLSDQIRERSLDSIRRILKRLQQKNVVKIYRDPWTKKNFYYLNEVLRKVFYPQSISNVEGSSLYHDLLVSRLSLEILKYNHVFQKSDLEHRIKETSKKSLFNEVVPDARLFGEIQGKSFIASIELASIRFLEVYDESTMRLRCDRSLKKILTNSAISKEKTALQN